MPETLIKKTKQKPKEFQSLSTSRNHASNNNQDKVYKTKETHQDPLKIKRKHNKDKKP